MTKETNTEKIFAKVSALERDQIHLSDSLNKHAEAINGFKTDILSEIRALREGQKGPNLVAFSGWASVVIVVIITVGGLSLAPIRDTQIRIQNRQEDARTRLMQNGWSKQDQIRFEKNFDNTLQREMRLLDEVLQREMHLNDKIIDTKLGYLERALKNLKHAQH